MQPEGQNPVIRLDKWLWCARLAKTRSAAARLIADGAHVHPAALAVEPARIKIIDVRESMTLEQFAQRYDASVPTKTLALINQIDVSDRLEAGRSYKTVQGGRLP